MRAIIPTSGDAKGVAARNGPSSIGQPSEAKRSEARSSNGLSPIGDLRAHRSPNQSRHNPTLPITEPRSDVVRSHWCDAIRFRMFAGARLLQRRPPMPSAEHVRPTASYFLECNPIILPSVSMTSEM